MKRDLCDKKRNRELHSKMLEFLKQIPGQIAGTFLVMIVCFVVISTANGVETIPVSRLKELLFLSVLGGILMELAFGTCIFKQMSDIRRVCIFTVPFACITFLCAAVFQWITQLDRIGTYLRFISIFLICGAISGLLFELEHWVRGKEYTRKLREYQERRKQDEQ